MHTHFLNIGGKYLVKSLNFPLQFFNGFFPANGMVKCVGGKLGMEKKEKKAAL